MPKMILKCGSCGSNNLPQAKYCNGCGEAVAILIPIPDPEPIKVIEPKSAPLLPWVLFVLILACGLVLLVRYDKDGKIFQVNPSITPESPQLKHQQLMEAAGTMPEIDPNDNSVYCVRDYLRQASLDIDLIEFSDWSKPDLVDKSGSGFWSVNVTITRRNQIGEVLTGTQSFLIQHNKVVEEGQ